MDGAHLFEILSLDNSASPRRRELFWRAHRIIWHRVDLVFVNRSEPGSPRQGTLHHLWKRLWGAARSTGRGVGQASVSAGFYGGPTALTVGRVGTADGCGEFGDLGKLLDD